jgi:hypothetical protein
MLTRNALLTAAVSSLLLLSCTQQNNRDVQAPPGNPNASYVPAEPVLERPTYRSLGAYWIIRGDENKNATVSLAYRANDKGEWTDGPDLFRVETGANDKGAPSEREEHTYLPIPKGSWLFAGSALMLKPDTRYEMRLTLRDPDGGEAIRYLRSHTIAEPVAPKNMKTLYVAPMDGSGHSGTGTKKDPIRGLKAANAAALPGTLFLLARGTYDAVVLTKSGEPGKPIIYRGDGDGEAVIRGKGIEATGRVVDLSNQHDVWLEKLSISNGDNGIVGHEASRLVIRRCKITNIHYGINATTNKTDKLYDFWISDNTILGPSVWPRSKGIEDARGIQISGAGHDVCYNYVKGFADAIDTYQGPRCEAIDFHNNECELLTDDGCEMDYSERNNRCYENRFTNAFQGISTQPLFGGPVYIFRNVVYNIDVEPIKIHNSPSGAIIFHNTFVRNGSAEVAMTPHGMYNFVVKNNLFVGTTGDFALELSLGKIKDSDWDYNGYAGGPWKSFMKWQSNPGGHTYKTVDEVRTSGVAERHCVLLDNTGLFAADVKIPQTKVEQKPQDLRLNPNSKAVDAGIHIKGLDDNFTGKAPDLGAYEVGQELPHYGPRPESK